MQGVRFDTNEVVWLLGAACQLYRIPFDAKLLLEQHPPPHTIESLREALTAPGFRTDVENATMGSLSMLSSQCFAILKQLESED